MTKFTLMAAAGILAAVPFVTSPAMAQVGLDVHVGDGNREVVRVHPRHRCKTVTVTTHRHGRRITRTERRCD